MDLGVKVVVASDGNPALEERLRVVCETIARNVVRLRGTMTQDQLAQRAGLSRQTVMSIEKGQAITLQNLVKLADALGVSPADLFISDEQLDRINYLSIKLFEKLVDQLNKR